MKLYPRSIIIDEDKDEYELNIKNSSNDERLLLFKIRRSEEKLVSFTPKSGIISAGTTIKIILKVYNRNIMKSRLLVKLNILKKSLFIENDFEQSWNIACTRATEIKKVVDVTNASLVGIQSIISKSTITNGSTPRVYDNIRNKRLHSNPILRRPSCLSPGNADTTDIQSVTSSVSMQVSIISDAYQSTSSSSSSKHHHHSSSHEENDQTMSCKNSFAAASMIEGSVIEFDTYSVVTNHIQNTNNDPILTIDTMSEIKQTKSINQIIHDDKSSNNSTHTSVKNNASYLTTEPTLNENFFQEIHTVDDDISIENNYNNLCDQVMIEAILPAHNNSGINDSSNNIMNHHKINEALEVADGIVGSNEELLLLKSIIELTQKTPQALEILSKLFNNNSISNNINNNFNSINETNNDSISNNINNNFNSINDTNNDSNSINSNDKTNGNNTTTNNNNSSSSNNTNNNSSSSNNTNNNSSSSNNTNNNSSSSNNTNNNNSSSSNNTTNNNNSNDCNMNVPNSALKNLALSLFNTKDSLFILSDNSREDKENMALHSSCMLELAGSNVCNDNFASIAENRMEQAMISKCKVIAITVQETSITDLKSSISLIFRRQLVNNQDDELQGDNQLKLLAMHANLVDENLKHLSINHSLLINIDSSINRFYNLTTLNLSSNKLSTILGPIILPQLKSLDISNNQLTSFDFLESLLSLQTLQAANNCFSSLKSSVNMLILLTSLSTLDLSLNPVADHYNYVSEVLDILPNIKYFDSCDIETLYCKSYQNSYHHHTLTAATSNKQSNKTNKQQDVFHNLPCFPIDIKNQSVVNHGALGSLSLKEKRDNFERRIKKYITQKRNRHQSISIGTVSPTKPSPKSMTIIDSGLKHNTKLNHSNSCSYYSIHNNNNNNNNNNNSNIDNSSSSAFLKEDTGRKLFQNNDIEEEDENISVINKEINEIERSLSKSSSKHSNHITNKDNNNNDEVKSLNTQDSSRSNRYNRSTTNDDDNEMNSLTNYDSSHQKHVQQNHYHSINKSKDDLHVYNYYSHKKHKEVNKKFNKNSLFADTESFKRRKQVNQTNNNKSNRNNGYNSESDIISKPLSTRKIAHTTSFVPQIFKEMQRENSRYNVWNTRYRIPKPIFGFSEPFIYRKEPTLKENNIYNNSNNDISFNNTVKRLRDGFQKIQPNGTFAREKKHLPVDFYPMDHSDVAFIRRKSKFSDPIGVQLCKDNTITTNDNDNKNPSISQGMLSISGSVIISPDKPGRRITYGNHQSRYDNSILLNTSNNDDTHENMFGFKKWHQELFSKENEEKLSHSFDRHSISFEDRSIESKENRYSYDYENSSLHALANKPIDAVLSSNTRTEPQLELPNYPSSGKITPTPLLKPNEITPTPSLKPKEIMQLVTQSYEESHKAITSSIELSNKKIFEYNPFYQDNSPPYDRNINDNRFHNNSTNNNNSNKANNSNNNGNNVNNDNSFYHHDTPPHINDSCIVEMASPEDINQSKSDPNTNYNYSTTNNNNGDDNYIFEVILPTDNEGNSIVDEDDLVDKIENIEDEEVAEEEVALSMYLSWLNSHQKNNHINYENLITSSINKSMTMDDHVSEDINSNNYSDVSENSIVKSRENSEEIVLFHPRELAMRAEQDHYSLYQEPMLDENSSSNHLRKLFNSPPKNKK